eukprot:CFRG5484T1
MSSFTGESSLDDAAELVVSKPTEDWALILEFCDRVSAMNTSAGAKDALTAIVKKINSSNPNYACQAVKLLECCFNNSGRIFQVECAQQPLNDEIYRLLQTKSNTPMKVCDAIKESLQNICLDVMDDSSFSRVLVTYHRLRREGYDFPQTDRKVPEPPFSSQSTAEELAAREDADLARAIEESLKASAIAEKRKKSKTKKKKKTQASSGVYPDSAAVQESSKEAEASENRIQSLQDDGKRRVKAIYTFEVQEEGELGFQAGDIVTLLDDGHPDWWKGELRGKTGLFPSNYVELFAKVTSPSLGVAQSNGHNGVAYATAAGDERGQRPAENGQIDVEIVDELLGRLLTAQSSATDAAFNREIERLYDIVVGDMLPILDNKIAVLDAKDQELGHLNETYCTSMAMYDHLARDAQLAFSGQPQQQGYLPAPTSYQTPRQY